jgi:hypothetical protein
MGHCEQGWFEHEWRWKRDAQVIDQVKSELSRVVLM